MKYSFHHLRNRAKERGIPFSLTFEQYEAFAIKTNYASMKGKTSLSLSIDRKDGGLGYHKWNIQALTLASNTRKQFVPYFNGGKMPEVMREEYNTFEREHRMRCEQIASTVSLIHPQGSPQFWKEYRARKETLFELEQEKV